MIQLTKSKENKNVRHKMEFILCVYFNFHAFSFKIIIYLSHILVVVLLHCFNILAA